MTQALINLKALALGCAALACVPLAHAGDAISTDRPDFVESSDVVGRGRFQIETSVAFERNTADGIKTRTTTTPTLLRLGVSDSLELRLETDGFVRAEAQDQASGVTQTERGFSDISLGVKWHVQDGDEASGKPGIAWLLHVDVDSGSAAFRGQGLRPSLRATFEWDLPQGFSVGVMPGVLLDKNDAGERFASGIFAVTLGKEFAPAWHGYVEIAGQQLASVKNGGSVVSFDTGVAYLVSDSVQVDLSLARGLTTYTPDLQWAVGLSVRF